VKLTIVILLALIISLIGSCAGIGTDSSVDDSTNNNVSDSETKEEASPIDADATEVTADQDVNKPDDANSKQDETKSTTETKTTSDSTETAKAEQDPKSDEATPVKCSDFNDDEAACDTTGICVFWTPGGYCQEPTLYNECQDPVFKHSLIASEDIQEIIPLGAIKPPGHTMPTAHIYLTTIAEGLVPLIAPTDIYITQIRAQSADLTPSESYDAAVDFSVCNDIYGHFGHVKGFSTDLQEVLAAIPCKDGNQEGPCDREVNHWVKAGEIFSYMKGTVDFGTNDRRVNLGYVNPELYKTKKESLRHVVCPLDLYDDANKTILEAKLVRNPAFAPLCGTVVFDVKGSIEGNWHVVGSLDRAMTWADDLNFVKGNTLPDRSYISIGGTITTPMACQIKFPAETVGEDNLAFENVTDPNKIYCYDAHCPGRILIRFGDDSKTTIKVEQMDGECTDPKVFSNQTLYER